MWVSYIETKELKKKKRESGKEPEHEGKIVTVDHSWVTVFKQIGLLEQRRDQVRKKCEKIG